MTKRKDVTQMQRANGMGNICKLSGNRRKKYQAVVVTGWKIDEQTGKAKKIRKSLGTFETQKEADKALTNYFENPHTLTQNTITFEEVYERWSEEHYQKVKEDTAKGYRAAYKLCSSIEHRKMCTLTIDDFQRIANESGKNTPTLKNYKNLLLQMCDYCILHDIWDSNKRYKIEKIDISFAGNPNKRKRERFTNEELETLWNNHQRIDYCNVVLMLLYSGVRISEMLNLKKENVNMQEHYFDVIDSKTQAGIRQVPIADRIYPFFEYWYNLNDCEYLLSTPEAKHFLYRNYYDSYWTPIMQELEMSHTPHDTRHTCISLLTEAEVDKRLIKKIVGHKSDNVTENVYTHIDIKVLLEQINKI